MVVVADASVAIRGDMSGFHKDLRGAQTAVGGLGAKIQNALSVKNLLRTGALFGLGSSIPGMLRNIVGLVGDASAAFSELQQTTRTVDAVFGDSADVIHDWGETAATAAGLSKREVNEAAAVMGQTLLNMGFAADEAAAKTVTLQQRAADLALAFGKDPQDAILAITAAMRGERDTIEKFGVSIKQADVNSRVLALGLDTSTTAAKKNSEAIAILDIILDQSASSAGRFADSQDDIAVKMEQNQARIDNFMASLGEGVANVQIDMLNDADQIGLMFDRMSDDVDEFAMNFGSQHVVILDLADSLGVDFGVMRDRISAAMQSTGQTFEEVVASMRVSSDQAADDFENLADNTMGTLVDAYQKGGPNVAREAGKIAGMFPSELRARIQEIRNAAHENVIAFAAGLLEKQNDPMLAWEAMLKAQENALTREAEITRLLGQLNSTELAAGLADGRPEVSLAAQVTASEIERRLRELGAWNWGYQTGVEYASGLAAATPLVEGAARGIASATGRQIGIQSEPKAPDSPLRGITKWGGNIVKTLADGIYGELGTGSSAAAALAGALVPSVSAGGGSLPNASGGLGNTYNVHLEDRLEVRTVDDIGYGLKRLGELGKLPGADL